MSAVAHDEIEHTKMTEMPFLNDMILLIDINIDMHDDDFS